MQQLLASLVVSMSVKDAAYKAGMATARREAAKTGQDVERSVDRMARAVHDSALSISESANMIASGLADAAKAMQRNGMIMTAAISAPLLVIGKKTKDSAAEFEAQFDRMHAAMVQASPDQLAALGREAMRLGPAFGKSAGEAASAVEMLAKNGLSASQILGGALTSAMALAVVGGADLSASADLTTDLMVQFNKQAGDLPDVVDKVTGALDASKMSFDDYRLAIGQTGGVAGGLGYSFEDTNVALAATASLFASGSDAGTSFKTFLTSLTPKSKEAAETMKALGLSFFDADGSAKSLADVAEMLRVRLSGLSDQAKTRALTEIFGTDAMRTAIGLMQQGRQGLEDVSRAIDEVKAKEKIEILQSGDEAASARLTAALNVLAIQMGEVLLPISTAVKNSITGVVETLSGLAPAFYVAGAGAALLAAAVGPLVTVIGYTLPVGLALLATRLTGVAAVVGFLINPFAFLIRLVGQLALARGAAMAVGLLAARFVSMVTPLGLVAAILTALIPAIFRKAQATEAAREATEAAAAADQAATDMSNRLLVATGKLREEIKRKAREDLKAAKSALAKAKADEVAARNTLLRAKADAMDRRNFATNTGSPGAVTAAMGNRFAAVADAEADLEEKIKAGWLRISAAQKLIDVATSPDAPLGPTDYTIPEKERKKKGPKAKSENELAREDAQYRDELGRLRVDELRALADLTESYRARYKADIAELDEDVASFRRGINVDETLTAAKRAQLMAAKEAEVSVRRQIAEQEMTRAEQVERFELLRDANEAEQEMTRVAIDMAESYAERRAGELRLLSLQRRLEEAELDRILAVAATGTAEWQNAYNAKQRLDATYAAREARVRRDTEGPAERYRRQIDMSTDQVREAAEEIGVSALERFNTTLADTATGFLKLGGIAGQVFNQLIADLMRVQLQKALIQPMANFLFGGGGGGLTTATAQGGVTSFLDNYLSYGGGKASGGRVSPRSWYMVGENGPEPFIPDTAGTIIPNGGLSKMQGPPAVIQLVADEGAMFVPRVQSISGEVSVQTVGAANASMARMQRRRLGRGG